LPELVFSEKRTIHYQLIEGDSQKPYLVFLHEGLGCIPFWKDFPRLLCESTGCPGLVYDRTGYGKSSPFTRPRTIHYLHESAREELPKILEALAAGKNFVLIGHSDGGSISLLFGAERPSHLQGIITEAAHVSVDEKTLAGVRKAAQFRGQKKMAALEKYHGEKTEEIFRAWSETWLSDWFRPWNIEYILPSIDVPVLAIQGKNDHYGSQNQAKTIAARSGGPGRVEIIDNCGHTPHLEAKQVVLDLMTDFINHLNP
jgi:pimeloyl-ACP methyl ester carboxylesterase